MVVGKSEILIGRSLLDAGVLPERSSRSRTAVLASPGSLGLADQLLEQLAAAGLPSARIDVPDGEAAKTLAQAEMVFEALNRLGLTRNDTLVAIGGGAVTDLGGFVAATYLRGIEAVYCPTTLLGAVDAAIGGKTGVNVGGKNLVGVFAYPRRVVIDVGVLEHLPDPLKAQGMAEALKAGLVGDPELVELLEADGLAANLREVVSKAVAVKVKIVKEDFREAGIRAVLNYGHTLGHAIELTEGLSHGEAVAIGMVAAGQISADETGFSDEARVASIIDSLGLPTRLATAPDEGRVLELVRLDKKRRADGVAMVLLNAIGSPVVRPVSEETILEALRSVSAT